jgi:signal transduction histidine kinase
MGIHSFYILFLTGAIFLLIISLGVLLHSYILKTKENRILFEETSKMSDMVERRVRERTKKLEMIRDSVSEYAVQKFELVQELEHKNKHIIKQKDDIHRQSEKLRLAYEEIKKLDKFKLRMTSMIIHDLKNPLNVLINVADNKNVAPKTTRIIKQVSYEMLELVMNIMDINKFRDSKMKINFENFELAVLLQKIFQKYSILVPYSSAQLKISIPEPCILYSDFKIIERVLENLVSNAIKFTNSDRRIEIGAIEQGDEIKIEIKDNGTGIPEELMFNIFDEYNHGIDKLKDYSYSTGLGLAYCKLAIEAQGGKIEVLSKIGEGTTVRFLAKKGIGQCLSDIKIYNTLAEELTETNHLDQNEVSIIKPVAYKIGKTSIYEGSAILHLLDSDVFNHSNKLLKWKESVETAVFSADEQLFRRLLDQIN